MPVAAVFRFNQGATVVTVHDAGVLGLDRIEIDNGNARQATVRILLAGAEIFSHSFDQGVQTKVFPLAVKDLGVAPFTLTCRAE